jgi:hypothetical protein
MNINRSKISIRVKLSANKRIFLRNLDKQGMDHYLSCYEGIENMEQPTLMHYNSMPTYSFSQDMSYQDIENKDYSFQDYTRLPTDCKPRGNKVKKINIVTHLIILL